MISDIVSYSEFNVNANSNILLIKPSSPSILHLFSYCKNILITGNQRGEKIEFYSTVQRDVISISNILLTLSRLKTTVKVTLTARFYLPFITYL